METFGQTFYLRWHFRVLGHPGRVNGVLPLRLHLLHLVGSILATAQGAHLGPEVLAAAAAAAAAVGLGDGLGTDAAILDGRIE